MLPLRVMVMLPVSLPPSLAMASVEVTVIIGSVPLVSSSAIFTVALDGEPSV